MPEKPVRPDATRSREDKKLYRTPNEGNLICARKESSAAGITGFSRVQSTLHFKHVTSLFVLIRQRDNGALHVLSFGLTKRDVDAFDTQFSLQPKFVTKP